MLCIHSLGFAVIYLHMFQTRILLSWCRIYYDGQGLMQVLRTVHQIELSSVSLIGRGKDSLLNFLIKLACENLSGCLMPYLMAHPLTSQQSPQKAKGHTSDFDHMPPIRVILTWDYYQCRFHLSRCHCWMTTRHSAAKRSASPQSTERKPHPSS